MWLDKEALDTACRNTSKQAAAYYVNCGGHAFGVNGWYQVGPDINWFNNGLSRCTRKGGWRGFERSCVKYILKDNPSWTLADAKAIDDVSVDPEKYEIIAFRIKRSFFGDFHFMKCEVNGDWTSKYGHNSLIMRCPYEDVHAAWKEYDGKEYFFVRKRTG